MTITTPAFSRMLCSHHRRTSRGPASLSKRRCDTVSSCSRVIANGPVLSHHATKVRTLPSPNSTRTITTIALATCVRWRSFATLWLRQLSIAVERPTLSPTIYPSPCIRRRTVGSRRGGSIKLDM